MTSIVKSSAVVDDRSATYSSGGAAPAPTPILKQGSLLRGVPLQSSKPVTIDQYQDQINRMRVEIAEATAELQALNQQLDNVREELGDAQAILEIEVDDAGARAEYVRSMQEQVRQEAEYIIAAAQQEQDAIREEARREGYQEGYQNGMEESKAEYQLENAPKAEQLQQLLEQLGSHLRQQVAENDAKLVDLALAVSRKILNREISADPKALVDMLYEILDENRREESVRITLARDLLPVEAKVNQEIKDMLCALGANVTVTTDDGLDDGGCQVETRKGIIDLGLETQLYNMAAALKTD